MAKTKNEPVPVDVYIQFVRSLFDNAHTVFMGAIIHATAAFLCFWSDGDPIYLAVAAVLFTIGMWRYLGMRRFHRIGTIGNSAEAWKWEREYLVKGSIQAFALGFFCFISLYVSADAFAQLAGFGVTLSSLVTVAGRNYGSPRMVAIFAASFVGPIGLGLVLRGDLPQILELLTDFTADPLAADRVMRLQRDELGGQSIARALRDEKTAAIARQLLVALGA